MANPPARQENLKVSYDYIRWVLATNRGIMGHLYQFTNFQGATDYFTDLDIDINYGNHLWKSSALRFEGLHRKVGIGLNVDEQTLKIWAGPNDTLFGGNFLTGAQEGLLDGSTIQRFRIVWKFVTGNAAVDVVQSQPIAVWPHFTGYTSTVVKGGKSHVELKVKSALVRLNTNMPRNYWQPGCLWTLFQNPGCTLSAAAFAITGTVGVNPTLVNIPIDGGVVQPLGADGINQYVQGNLVFNSGVNDGLRVLIDNNDAIALYLAYPLLTAPAFGDAVTFYPGCSKSFNTCQVKFFNEANFRGYDKVPPIMLSV